MKWHITFYNEKVEQETLNFPPEERIKFGKKTDEGDKKMTRPTLAKFKEKAFTNSEVKKEYEALSVAYNLRKKLIAMRKKAGLTQEQLAEILSTKKSNISRLENVYSSSSPKLSTIEEYAQAVGYQIKIDFVPIKPSE